MGAAVLAFEARVRVIQIDVPENDNAAPFEGFCYAPYAPPHGVVHQVFIMVFWSSRIRTLAAGLVARGILS